MKNRSFLKRQKESTNLKGSLEIGKTIDKIASVGGRETLSLAASTLSTNVGYAPTSASVFEVVILQKRKALAAEKNRQLIANAENIFRGFFRPNLRQFNSTLSDAYNNLLGGVHLSDDTEDLINMYPSFIQNKSCDFSSFNIVVNHEKLLPILFKKFHGRNVRVIRGNLIEMTLFESGLIGCIEETQLYGRQHFTTLMQNDDYNRKSQVNFIPNNKNKFLKYFSQCIHPIKNQRGVLVYAVVDIDVTLPLIPSEFDISAMGVHPGAPLGGRRCALAPDTLITDGNREISNPARIVNRLDRELENGSARVKGLVKLNCKRCNVLQNNLDINEQVLDQEYKKHVTKLREIHRTIVKQLPQSSKLSSKFSGIQSIRRQKYKIKQKTKIPDWNSMYEKQRSIDHKGGRCIPFPDINILNKSNEIVETNGKTSRYLDTKFNDGDIPIQDLVTDTFMTQTETMRLVAEIRLEQKLQSKMSTTKMKESNPNHFSRRQKPAPSSKTVQRRRRERAKVDAARARKRRPYVKGRHSSKLRKEVQERLKRIKERQQRQADAEIKRNARINMKREIVIGDKVSEVLRQFKLKEMMEDEANGIYINSSEDSDDNVTAFDAFIVGRRGHNQKDDKDDESVNSDDELMAEMEAYRKERQEVRHREVMAAEFVLRKKNSRFHRGVCRFFGNYYFVQAKNRNVGLLHGVQLTAFAVSQTNKYNDYFSIFVPETKNCSMCIKQASRFLMRSSGAPMRSTCIKNGEIVVLKAWSRKFIQSNLELGVFVRYTNITTHKTETIFVPQIEGGTSPQRVSQDFDYFSLDLHGKMKFKENIFNARLPIHKKKWLHYHKSSGRTWTMSRKRMAPERRFASVVVEALQEYRKEATIMKKAKQAAHAATLAATRALKDAVSSANNFEWMLVHPGRHIDEACDYLLKIGAASQKMVNMLITENRKLETPCQSSHRNKFCMIESQMVNALSSEEFIRNYNASVVQAQSQIRGWLTRNEYQQKQAAGLTIQRRHRGNTSRCRCRKRRQAAHTITRYTRRYSERHVEKYDYACHIQGQVRCRQGRKRYQKQRRCITLIQKTMRGRFTRMTLKNEKQIKERIFIKASEKITSTWRMVQQKHRYTKLKNGILLFQKIFRQYIIKANANKSKTSKKFRKKSVRVLTEQERMWKGSVCAVVEIVKCGGLPLPNRNTDDPYISNPNPDPYISLACGLQKFTSTIKKKTVNPIWHEQFELNFDSLSTCQASQLNFHIHDWNFWKKRKSHDLLCSGSIDFDEFKTGTRSEYSIELQSDIPSHDGGMLVIWVKVVLDNKTTTGKSRHPKEKNQMQALAVMKKTEASLKLFQEREENLLKMLENNKSNHNVVITRSSPTSIVRNKVLSTKLKSVFSIENEWKEKLSELYIEKFPVYSKVLTCEKNICLQSALYAAIASAESALYFAEIASSEVKLGYAFQAVSKIQKRVDTVKQTFLDASTAFDLANMELISERRVNGLLDDTLITDNAKSFALSSKYEIIFELIDGHSFALINENQEYNAPCVTWELFSIKENVEGKQFQKSSVLSNTPKNDIAVWHEQFRFKFTSLEDLQNSSIRLKLHDCSNGHEQMDIKSVQTDQRNKADAINLELPSLKPYVKDDTTQSTKTMNLIGTLVINLKDLCQSIGFSAWNWENRVLNVEPQGVLNIRSTITRGSEDTALGLECVHLRLERDRTIKFDADLAEAERIRKIKEEEEAKIAADIARQRKEEAKQRQLLEDARRNMLEVCRKWEGEMKVLVSIQLLAATSLPISSRDGKGMPPTVYVKFSQRKVYRTATLEPFTVRSDVRARTTDPTWENAAKANTKVFEYPSIEDVVGNDGKWQDEGGGVIDILIVDLDLNKAGGEKILCSGKLDLSTVHNIDQNKNEVSAAKATKTPQLGAWVRANMNKSKFVFVQMSPGPGADMSQSTSSEDGGDVQLEVLFKHIKKKETKKSEKVFEKDSINNLKSSKKGSKRRGKQNRKKKHRRK